MKRDIRPDQLPTFQVHNDEAIEKFEADGGDNKQVDRHRSVNVIGDKRLPCVAARPGMAAQGVSSAIVLSHWRWKC